MNICFFSQPVVLACQTFTTFTTFTGSGFGVRSCPFIARKMYVFSPNPLFWAAKRSLTFTTFTTFT